MSTMSVLSQLFWLFFVFFTDKRYHRPCPCVLPLVDIALPQYLKQGFLFAKYVILDYFL